MNFKGERNVHMSKEIYLTSSPFWKPMKPFSNKNGFLDKLKKSIGRCHKAVLISSSPDDYEQTEEFSNAVKYTMEFSGIDADEFVILDGRNKKYADEIVGTADFVILAGGHVPTQNAFFVEIQLKELMQEYNGVIMGISAGSMNAAAVVYSQPEEPGEAIDPDYVRFMPGLDLTKKMIIPHYQDTKDDILDGMKLYEEITYPDSHGHEFYALCDGSYIYSNGEYEKLYGEAYLIHDGKIRQICSEDEELLLE